MGAKHPSDRLRQDLAGVMPRSWGELELFYARFQQEVFRRRSSEPQSQFFITFSIFRASVSPTRAGGDHDDRQEKERLLRAFHTLSRPHRQRIAAADFFAGLALVTTGKKAAKAEFLFSLLDNGGLKIVNACEIEMILWAAARGLEMLKFTSGVDERLLNVLARRLAGGELEVLRTDLVGKVQMDPEIVFFMNDLDHEATTTSDSLLSQQYALMKSSVAIDLQKERIRLEGDRDNGEVRRRFGRLDEGSPQSEQKRLGWYSESHSQLHGIDKSKLSVGIEATLRRLEAAVVTQSSQVQAPTRRKNHPMPELNPPLLGAKRVDVRTLSRLVNFASNGSLSLPERDAEASLKFLNIDMLGNAKSSQIVRLLRPYLANLSVSSTPVWKNAERYLHDLAHSWKLHWFQWFSPPQNNIADKCGDFQTLHGCSELNYNIKAHVNLGRSTSQEDNAKSSFDSERSSQMNDSPMRFRLRAHQLAEPLGDTKQRDRHFTMVLRFQLKSELSDDEAIDVVSAVETFFSDSAIQNLTDFALDSCHATVVELQPSESNHGVSARCLCLRIGLTGNVFEAFEASTGCKLSHLLRGFFFSVELGISAVQLIRTAKLTVQQFSQLVKPAERNNLLRTIFAQFDNDKDGQWSFQDFNAFQQAAQKRALDDLAFARCFGEKRVLSADDFIKCFEHYSTDDYISLIESVGLGSLIAQVKGICTGNVSLDKNELRRLESSLSPRLWAYAQLKSMMFTARSMSDFSCEVHYRSLSEVLQLFGIEKRWWKHLGSPTSLVNGFNSVCSFFSPKHVVHERDFDCRSLFCSIEDELAKSTQQLDFDDQQRNLPSGTGARRASTLIKIYKAALFVLKSANSIDMVSIESPQINVVCELDNFNWIYLVREQSQTSAI